MSLIKPRIRPIKQQAELGRNRFVRLTVKDLGLLDCIYEIIRILVGLG